MKANAGLFMVTTALQNVEEILPHQSVAVCDILASAKASKLEHLVTTAPWDALLKLPLTFSLLQSLKLRLLGHAVSSLGHQCAMCKIDEESLAYAVVSIYLCMWVICILCYCFADAYLLLAYGSIII